MKALILDGTKRSENALRIAQEAVENELKNNGWDVTSLTLRDMQIAPCLGCFGCWVRTPGVCVINDAQRDIMRMAFQSDLLVFLTPVTFGGVSAEIKKVIDRFMSIVLPLFVRVKGEIHHVRRYSKHPHLFFVGLLNHPDHEAEEIFRTLAGRIALNSRASSGTSEIVMNNEEESLITQKIKTGLNSIKY